MKSFGERITDALVADRLLLPEQLNEVIELQKKQGGRLLKLLLDRQFVTEQDMMASMGRCLGTPPVTLAKMRVPQEVVDLIPKDMAISYKMVAVATLGKKLFVVMADPLNVLALDDLRRVRPNMEIIPLISTEKAVTDFLNNAQTAASDGIDELLKSVDMPDVEIAKDKQEEINLDRLIESSE
jgi:type IV pilus assembly protein PilB